MCNIRKPTLRTLYISSLRHVEAAEEGVEGGQVGADTELAGVQLPRQELPQLQLRARHS